MDENQTSLFPEEDRLKNFMEDHFDFSALKKAGVYPKEMKAKDYEGQAKIICRIFGYESIYEYGREVIRCHISYADPRPKPNEIPRYRQFIETIGGLKTIKEEGKVIPLNSSDQKK